MKTESKMFTNRARCTEI